MAGGLSGVGQAISGAANNSTIGRGVNDYMLGIPGAVGTVLQGGNPLSGPAASLSKPTPGSQAEGQLSASQQAEYGANTGVINNMAQANTANLGYQQGQAKNYEAGQTAATQQYDTQGNANQAQVQQLQKEAQGNASQAMTIQQMENPNNSVATAVQNQYNQQGQAANAQGLADVGVLQAMGSQATGQSMQSGQPMTGGQLAAIQGANQQQASQAMGNTQAYIQNLRTQGLQAGQQQSNFAYNAGQGAINTASGLTNQLSGLQGQQYGVDTANNTNQYNINAGLGNLNASYAQQAGQNQLGVNNALYGGQQAAATGQVQAAQAQANGEIGALGNIASSIGGAAVGSAMAPTPNVYQIGAPTAAPGTTAPAAPGTTSSLNLTNPNQAAPTNGGGAGYPGVQANGGGYQGVAANGGGGYNPQNPYQNPYQQQQQYPQGVPS